MPVRLPNATAEAGLDAMLALLDGGSIEMRTGNEPTANGAVSGTLVLEYALSNPAFPGSAGDGTNASAAANGLPINDDALITHDFAVDGYGIGKDSGGNKVLTGNIGATGSGATFELADLSPTLGDTVALTAINATMAQQGS